MYFEGVIYLPQQRVDLNGGSEAYSPSPYTAFVVDTLNITGNGSLVINNDTTRTSVTIPPALLFATGGQPRLVR
jgi:hypothetical protein